MTFDFPINTQWQDRGVETGGAGPSLATVSPVHVSPASASQSVGYKELAREAARERARWTIKLDPTVLFVRQDGERPVFPIKESGIAKLAADLDPEFAQDMHEFLALQAKERTLAQNLCSPNIDRPKPEPEPVLHEAARTKHDVSSK